MNKNTIREQSRFQYVRNYEQSIEVERAFDGDRTTCIIEIFLLYIII
jgi:hypothetical protein